MLNVNKLSATVNELLAHLEASMVVTRKSMRDIRRDPNKLTDQIVASQDAWHAVVGLIREAEQSGIVQPTDVIDRLHSDLNELIAMAREVLTDVNVVDRLKSAQRAQLN